MKVSLGSMGEWFRGRLTKVVGNGKNTHFWEDVWAGDVSLKLKFPRLYHISLYRGERIGDMGVWEEGRWCWKWRWRREFFEREMESVNAFLSLINRFPLVRDNEDLWKWTGASCGGYNTKDGYHVLNERNAGNQIGEERRTGFKMIWRSYAPVKVVAHTWRVLWDRLPTKMNLLRRKILDTNSNLKCVLCGEKDESGKHFFFECSISYKVWMKCFK